jgi:hypothetical protein
MQGSNAHQLTGTICESAFYSSTPGWLENLAEECDREHHNMYESHNDIQIRAVGLQQLRLLMIDCA